MTGDIPVIWHNIIRDISRIFHAKRMHGCTQKAEPHVRGCLSRNKYGSNSGYAEPIAMFPGTTLRGLLECPISGLCLSNRHILLDTDQIPC